MQKSISIEDWLHYRNKLKSDMSLKVSSNDFLSKELLDSDLLKHPLTNWSRILALKRVWTVIAPNFCSRAKVKQRNSDFSLIEERANKRAEEQADQGRETSERTNVPTKE